MGRGGYDSWGGTMDWCNHLGCVISFHNYVRPREEACTPFTKTQQVLAGLILKSVRSRSPLGWRAKSYNKLVVQATHDTTFLSWFEGMGSAIRNGPERLLQALKTLPTTAGQR